MSGYAQVNPLFSPALRLINNITNGYPATVTTTFAHGYNTGEICRLWVPRGYGMVQANQLFAPIVVTGDTTFTIAIDTTTFDAFIYPDAPTRQKLPQAAQVTNIGDQTYTLIGAIYNTLPFTQG